LAGKVDHKPQKGGDDKKFDLGKLRMDLVPEEWLIGLAEVCQYGADKYSDWAWAKNPVERHRLFAAAKRHIAAFRMGEQFDAEAKELANVELDHRVMAAWNLLADYYYDLKEEDRNGTA